jgi:hypothetical protein
MGMVPAYSRFLLVWNAGLSNRLRNDLVASGSLSSVLEVGGLPITVNQQGVEVAEPLASHIGAHLESRFHELCQRIVGKLA